MSEFSELKGLTITSISGLTVGSDEVIFTTSCGRFFKMYHYQDCCEGVCIVDVNGEADDLLGEKILLAEEVSSCDDEPPIMGSETFVPETRPSDSWTWTFYRIATKKGFVVIRWLGESNGYYSERVDFEEQITEEFKS